jgi:hypothetical protein
MFKNKIPLIVLSLLAFPLASIFGYFTYHYFHLAALSIHEAIPDEAVLFLPVFATLWLIPTSIVVHFSAKHLHGKGSYLQDLAALGLALAFVDLLMWFGWLGGPLTFWLALVICFFPYVLLHGWLLKNIHELDLYRAMFVGIAVFLTTLFGFMVAVELLGYLYWL